MAIEIPFFPSIFLPSLFLLSKAATLLFSILPLTAVWDPHSLSHLQNLGIVNLLISGHVGSLYLYFISQDLVFLFYFSHLSLPRSLDFIYKIWRFFNLLSNSDMSDLSLISQDLVFYFIFSNRDISECDFEF